MSEVKIKQLTPSLRLGEGPHWDEANQALLFVDILKGNLHRFFTTSGRQQILHIEPVSTGASVTVVVPVEGDPDLFLVCAGRSVGLVKWSISDPDNHSAKMAVVHSVDAGTTNRFNDGKCDPRGRLWAGTMGHEPVPGDLQLHQGTLYRFDSDLRASHWVDKISISNGMAWSADLSTLYYIDTLDYSVDAFDYCDATGDIKNRRKVLDYKPLNFGKDVPDGMTIDTDGNLWVANFYGGKVICINPKQGKIIRQIDFPAKHTTSVVFGGPNYDILYVTSAQFGLSEEELKSEPAHGATFEVTGLGVKGLPSHNFKGNLTRLHAIMRDGK